MSTAEQKETWMNSRKSGILLHISSLPSAYGIGDMGPWAFHFADLLYEARQCMWQVLPINPTSTSLGNSPYNSDSAFAGNPLFISPELLEKEGLVSKHDLEAFTISPGEKVDYESVTSLKRNILNLAFQQSRKSIEKEKDFKIFCEKHAFWLENYALFKVLKEHYRGEPWNHFSHDLVIRTQNAIDRHKEQHKGQILFEKFLQFIFYKQWESLKKYCNGKKIRIIGDIPIYVQYDSADVWTNPDIFHLDEHKKPWIVSGVPPDYFSKTGQLWGNPLYNWEAIKSTHYSWWIQRLAHNLSLFDLIRLDHFRGFVAYWRVPAGEKTAEHGEWAPAPAEEFLKILFSHFEDPMIIAEDLGVITPDVNAVMEKFRIPGMKVLVFGFGGDMATHPFLPHNYRRNSVVYTGTHDTNTVLGWFRKEVGLDEKGRICAYLGKEVNEGSIHVDMTRLAMMSVASTVIIPMQDVLGLGENQRMNLPGSQKGNWEWRLKPEQLNLPSFEQVSLMTQMYGRADPLWGRI
ncbi:MAG: 4-alpha-glucanotransferase [Nitrospiria bacterium]